MKVGLAFIAALMAAPFAVNASEPDIPGIDDRLVSSEHRFAAVGRLFQAGTGFCTATLISPDVVVTAAHCVFHAKSGRPIAPGSLHFAADWRQHSYKAWRRAAQIRIAAGFEFNAPKSANRLKADLALIKLSAPIPENLVKPVTFVREVKRLSRSIPLTQVSYSRDRPAMPLIERGCYVHEEDESILLTDCDSYLGSSGAPIFDDSGEEPKLLAVQAAVFQKGNFRRSAALRARAIEIVRRKGKNPIRRLSALKTR